MTRGCGQWSNSAAIYADCNGDDAINALDFQVIFLNWGRVHSQLPTTSASFSIPPLASPLIMNCLSLKVMEKTEDSITYQIQLEKNVVGLNSIYLALTYDPRFLQLDNSSAREEIQPIGFLQEAMVVTKSERGRTELVLGLPGFGASGKGEIVLIKFQKMGKGTSLYKCSESVDRQFSLL